MLTSNLEVGQVLRTCPESSTEIEKNQNFFVLLSSSDFGDWLSGSILLVEGANGIL